MRLVFCDDNRLLGEALAAALHAWGHQAVAITTSAAAGVAAVTEHMPDACLLDLRFPGGEDGLTAARKMRMQCPGTKVVVLSGALDPAVAANIRYGYYPAGHMMYIDPASAHKLKADLDSFYDSAM